MGVFIGSENLRTPTNVSHLVPCGHVPQQDEGDEPFEAGVNTGGRLPRHATFPVMSEKSEVLEFRKSSLSESNGQCVEVARAKDVFVKSSLSEQNGACIEVARRETAFIVRNSRDREGPTLQFTLDEWQAFVGGVKLGEFDVS